MKLIVGLGNPGREYQKTRHNIGFMVLDELANSENLSFSNKSKFRGEIAQAIIKQQEVIFLKPKTFMNLSGEAVLAVKQFYNIASKDVLIIHDDLDLPCGKVRIKQKGGAGGHNGIKSIISCLNDENFHRLKIGIDREELIQVHDYVLGKFSKDQLDAISSAIANSIDIVYEWIEHDIVYVMNKYN